MDTSPIFTDFTIQRRRQISKQTIACREPEMLTAGEEKVEVSRSQKFTWGFYLGNVEFWAAGSQRQGEHGLRKQQYQQGRRKGRGCRRGILFLSQICSALVLEGEARVWIAESQTSDRCKNGLECAISRVGEEGVAGPECLVSCLPLPCIHSYSHSFNKHL